MRIVERKDIDEVLWNSWCENSSEFSPFSRLAYLDAVADNLLFVVNEDQTGGLALPYLERMGVKTLYTPVFCRWIMWLGENRPSVSELTIFVCTYFKQAAVYTHDHIFEGEKETLIYQILEKADFALNSQVRRKLKKAANENWQISWDAPIDNALFAIESSLKNKFATLENTSFPKLRRLALNLKFSGLLRVISLLNKEGETVGSLLLIVDKKHCLYLKGACEESTKMAGGMYFLMNAAINFAFDNDFIFDFGGSRIPGVRKFNLSFGSRDKNYHYNAWNRGPFWYSILKSIRHIAKK
jgi:hypothetical protein